MAGNAASSRQLEVAEDHQPLVARATAGGKTAVPPKWRSGRVVGLAVAAALGLVASGAGAAAAWHGVHNGRPAPAATPGSFETSLTEAKFERQNSEEFMKKARSIEHMANEDLNAAKARAKKELALAQAQADKKMDHAQSLVDQALQATAAGRMCVDLPGVKLTDAKYVSYPSVVGKPDTDTAVKCKTWCSQHATCNQALFVAGNKGCYLFTGFTTKPVEFRDGMYNTSYCGKLHEKGKMISMIKKVFHAKPYVPPLKQCAWAGDDCSKSKCCANVPVANFDFTKFQWYTCYKKTPYFAGCHLGPAPGDWEGTVLGHMGTREVPKAPPGVLVQEPSLYCIAIVTWGRAPTKPFWDSEAALANNFKSKGLSIMKCDAHDFIDGAPLNAGGDGSSINNIDSFIQAWNKVRDYGRYLKYGWTVKVDSDAVFFPERLKMHLHNLRTPAGSRVYLQNIDFKFKFMGALEVFTREALQTYLLKNGECAGKVGHQGGEDYYMKSCMDGIGIDHQTDVDLLNDKYAKQGNCNDPWAVAFHFYKKVGSWNYCHQAAVNAWNAAHKPGK